MRAWWAAGAIALLLVVVVLALRLNGRGDAPAAQAHAPVGAQVHTPVGAQASASTTPSAPVARPTTPAPIALPASNAADAAPWTLCGLGRVPRPPGGPTSASGFDALRALPAPLGEQALADARERTAAALATGNPRQRAAALLLRGFYAPGRERLAPAVGALAVRGGDAVVTRWALTLCAAAGRGTDCGGLPARELPSLEPDNAAAWLALAESEPAAAAEAWPRALQARRFDMHDGAFTATVVPAVPPDLPAYLVVALGVEALGIDIALAPPPLGPLFAHCRPAPPDGSVAQRECAAMAGLLLDSADTLRDRRVGLRLAELAAWPADRLAAARTGVVRLAEAQAAWAPEPGLDCAATDRYRRWFDDLGRYGEVRALQQRLQAAGAPR